MKDLAECEATRISDWELIEKLKAQCSELKSQRTQAEEQLCEMETRLSEAKEKNRQLSEQTNDALAVKVNRCLRGFVSWQIETHKWLQLRDLERRATAMKARSVSGQRRLPKKLDAFLTSSRDVVLNLELELAAVLQSGLKIQTPQ
ncbi:hypothetical protein AXG93_942s1030 [Marchantia polymorpha subsp. ruderalis]|uniref:Uncharacterized protein n=1 Tax=Marchantia polymorpha subsp. ruderalis TaxID=1480154 RepID=A0A176WBB4_MARPO|nr:hypothetical protein AXG93_942s1030 [Marchantia polymorpha subsp. ruderalis]